VVSGFVGRSGYMSAAQVREIDVMGMVVVRPPFTT